MRTTKAFVFGAVALIGGFGALLACGSDSYVPGNGGTTTTDEAGGGGEDSGGADAGTITGSNCDPKITTGPNACPPSEGLGYFVVAGSKTDGADGTRNNPFAKIQDGIDAAKKTTAKSFVYVCVGDYKEALTLADGVSIFGGWDCANANWTVVNQHASLHAPSSPAVTGDGLGLTSGATLDSLDIFAPDGTKDSRSSVGMVITKSTHLKVSNCTIQAGNGFDGEDGVDGVALTQIAGVNGANANLGGFLGNCTKSGQPNCADNNVGGGSSVCSAPADAGVNGATFNGGPGGAGGTGGSCALSATVPCYANSTLSCYSCTPTGTSVEVSGGAQPGNSATTQGGVFSPVHIATQAKAADGTNGANGSASFQGSTLVIHDGTAGENGKPGVGGGGGSGMPPYMSNDGTSLGRGALGSGGAGGGAGGCPGLAGTAGTAGGASVAVITVDSIISFATCLVSAGNGGKAGRGTFGSASTPGGTGGENAPGSPTPNIDSLPSLAANGSPGGNAGWSGNGSAGSSYGIASHGSAPTLTDTDPKNGTGGVGVDARTSGTKTIPATPAGDALATTTF